MVDIALKGDINARQLSAEILNIPEFCRDESSINVSDLISYSLNGINFYIINDGKLNGVITFDINVDKIYIYGLCAPGPSMGIGTQLLETVKKFAKVNGIKTIKLTCYGSVVDFYTKNGFKIESQSEYRSDDSDDESEPKIKFNMIYNVTAGGKRKKGTKKYRKKLNSKRKYKKTKKHYR